MVGNINADNMPANESSSARTDSEMTSNTNSIDPQGTDSQYVYVQLRPGNQQFRKCVAHLEETISKHPDVNVQIAGFASEDHQFLLTLSVDLGPRDKVAKFSAESIAAFNFASAVYADLFDFLPQYTGVPTPAEREWAARLPTILAASPGETSASVAL